MPDFVWAPSDEFKRRANLTRLMERLDVERFDDLHRISVEDPERFWPAVVDDLGFQFSERWERVLDTSRGREWATWFVGAKLNLAHECVRRWASERGGDEAAVWLPEEGPRQALTWSELSDAVRRLA